MDTETAYNETLDYLYSFIDYSLKKTAELARAHFDLGRMRDLLALLGNPQDSYPIIHVAGTKGKGSTSALAASALRAAGHPTGLNISPHLQDYAERIQVDGVPIPHADLVALVEEIKPFVVRVPQLTTFEITTALGFLYFARKKVDAAVVEVGLGGRLDATNVVNPCVSVITSLSYDHMAVLGSTLKAIAGEKAGIIKEGIPVVTSPQKDEALAVLERIALERHAPMALVGRDVLYAAREHSLDGQTFSIVYPGSGIRPSRQISTAAPVILRIPLLGAHQVVNAATAYTALQMSGMKVPEAAIRAGFEQVSWPCRFEVVRREPPVVLDSAHNVDSARQLRKAVEDYFPSWPVILIFAVLEDKDAQGILAELAPHLVHVIATQAHHPRAFEAEKLVGLAQQAGVPVEAVKPAAAALERALDLAGGRRLVLVAGSVAFAGEMKTAWEGLNRS